MTIDRLRYVLSEVGPPPDARELGEMLWLACHISPTVEETPPAPSVPREVPETPLRIPEPAPPPVPAPPRPSEPLTGLHSRPGPETEPAGEAAEVLVPTAPMLADPLGLQRALRPLKRRVPSPHRLELDEEATAARIAETHLWTPVLTPSPERWLTLSLVVDTGPTMRLWRPLARELAEALVRQGAFRDVHVSYLDTTGRIASAPESPPQDPGTLMDASGRRTVLVLSDCSGPHWWNGRAAQAVRRWAQAGPTAILQPLPESLWRRTAAPTTPGLAVLPRPGAPNTGLRFTPFDGPVTGGVPVPVLEVAPRWFAAWARLLSGSAPQPTAMATLPSRPSGTAPVNRERDLPIADRVRRFLATASQDAAELAAHVAVSVPSLPVMRLIQHRILGGSGPGQLAEVLLSGLLRPTGGVRYEFVPGAREALLDTLPRPEAQHTRHVLEAVSAEIERRAGTSAETFRALLPTDGGPVTLTADTDHFAILTPKTRANLTPTPSTAPSAAPDLLELLGRRVDELIDDWDRAPRPTVIGLDGEDPVTLDILNGHPDLPHGSIRAPRSACRRLLRAIVWSLALSHSPDNVNFAFVAISTRGRSLGDLRDLPHVFVDAHGGPASRPPISELPQPLEAEQRRREVVLQSAGVDTWDEYQAAIADGRALDPLPALIVIIDNVNSLLDVQPDLLDPLARLYDTGSAQGIKFIICSPEHSPPPLPLTTSAGWNMGPAWQSGDLAFLHVFAQRTHPSFRPARVSPDVSDHIIGQMRRRASQTRQLPSPAKTPVSPAVPESDVLDLNGGGSSGMFQETWALPASTPRNPAIGYDADGNVLTLYPLDLSSGIPHGLIVGAPEARQRIVRVITLALAAGHSPANLNFAFAGLGEHPLGEPLDLPHVRYSEDELLGHPEKLQRFIDFLSDELDARAPAAPRDVPGSSDFDANEDHRAETPPRLLVVADVSLTLPMSRPQVGEALLSLAQRGRALGVQLLLTSTTIENTTIWDRFLPLLGWRIAAGARRPTELQRIMGRASLSFPDERTAYFLGGGGSPHRFTVAEEPTGSVIESFVRRMRDHWRATTVPAGAGPIPADPERSRAVLIGVSKYTLLSDLPAVRNNLSGLKELLCDPRVWGLPERNCVVLAEPSGAAQILDAVERAAWEAEDALLVYYAGHGLRDEAEGTLSLPLPASRTGKARTALPYDWLQRAVATPGGPRHKVVLLDCCFSGRVPVDFGPPLESPDGGMYVMTSASGNESALIASDGIYTAFTGELIATVEEGLAGAPTSLDMTTIGDAVQQRLTAKGIPITLSSYSRGDGAAVRLFRNRAFEASSPELPGTARPSGPRPVTDTALLDRMIRQLDRTVEDPTVRAALRRLLEGEAAAIREGRPPGPRNLVVTGPYGPHVEALAEEYGRVLVELGVISNGSVSTTSWTGIAERLPEAAESLDLVFQMLQGGLLLVQGTDEPDPAGGYFRPDVVRTLIAAMDQDVADSLVVLSGGAEQVRAVRAAAPEFGRHFTVLDDGRVPIGIEVGTREPVFVDFDEDPHLVVAGPPTPGRANTLRLLIEGVASRADGREAEIQVFDANEILRSIAEEFGIAEPVGPGVGYTDSPEVFARVVDEVLNRPPATEVFLFVIDRDLDDDPLPGITRILLSSLGGRVHIVLAPRLLTSPGQPLDPLVSMLHDVGAPALLMGSGYGEETRLYGAEPPHRSVGLGRAVLTHRGRQRVLQVAYTPPET